MVIWASGLCGFVTQRDNNPGRKREGEPQILATAAADCPPTQNFASSAGQLPLSECLILDVVYSLHQLATALDLFKLLSGEVGQQTPPEV